MSKNQTSDQLQGLPMSHLIGGPLSALCEGQAQLARTTKDFIEDVGLTEDQQLRMIEFSYHTPVEIPKADGDVQLAMQKNQVQLPLISIVSVPNLQVESADINFTMEVKSSRYVERHHQQHSDSDSAPKRDTATLPFEQRKRTVLSGSVTSNNRSQTAATFDIKIKARQQAQPEGLSRIMDMLHKTIAPIQVGEPKPIKPVQE